jgi:hypothetical protein
LSPTRLSPRTLSCVAFVAAFGVALALGVPGPQRSPQVASAPRTKAPRDASGVHPSAATHGFPRGTAQPGRSNVDADAREPRLRTAHRHLLDSEPLLQRLPYRDRELGVALAGVARDGKPVLLVTYRNAAAAAREDMSLVLERLADHGGEYVLRFRRLAEG